VNAIRQAKTAYGPGANSIKTPRGAEYETLARVTMHLKNAQDRGPEGFAELVAALHDNRRLWTILASDVADHNNPLPPQLRARIVYLAEFTQLHSQAVLNRTANADPLIEINSTVMSGLRNRGAAS